VLEEIRVSDAYFEKFGGFSCCLYPDIVRAMRRALKTGVDQPILIKRRQEIERAAADYDAKIAAKHEQPFTPELERHYTAPSRTRP
jgi:hypothetical protein